MCPKKREAIVIEEELVLWASELQSRCEQICSNAHAMVEENSLIMELSRETREMRRLSRNECRFSPKQQTSLARGGAR